MIILKGISLYSSGIAAVSFKNFLILSIFSSRVIPPPTSSEISLFFSSLLLLISIIELVHCIKPVGKISSPKKAFINVDFPLFASPVTKILYSLFLIFMLNRYYQINLSKLCHFSSS